MKIYLAGPMRGKPRFNFDEFARAAKYLRRKGEEVVSPAEMDLAEGFDPDNPGEIDEARYEQWMERYFKMIDDCDAIALLPGWRLSEGARREYQYSVKAGKFAIVLSTHELDAADGPQPCDRCKQMHPPTEDCVFAPLEAEKGEVVDGCPHCKVPAGMLHEDGCAATQEVRVTNEKTGGQKGRKPERFDLIPAVAMRKVARLYGRGTEKYAAHNWRRGHNWSLSIAALERHLAAFKEGEDFDGETKCEHLASVVFHALSLLTFADEHPELDDRWKGAK